MAGQTVERAANFSKGRGKCWSQLYLNLSAAFSVNSSSRTAHNVQLMQSALKALNKMCEQIVHEAITERNLIRRTGPAHNWATWSATCTWPLGSCAQTRCQTMWEVLPSI